MREPRVRFEPFNKETSPFWLILNAVVVANPAVEVEIAKRSVEPPAEPARESLAYGEVVPMPNDPLSNTLTSVVDALLTTSNAPPVPVPLANTVNLDDGIVELPIATRGQSLWSHPDPAETPYTVMVELPFKEAV